MGQHHRGNRAHQRRDNRGPTSVNLDKRVIECGGKILVETADTLGRKLNEIKPDREKLSKSQIRNIYGAVKQMQMKGGLDPHKLLMLKPKLAYAAKRHGKGVNMLKEILTPAIDMVGDDPANFDRFVDFFEAILAYHRAYGGSE